VSLNLPSILVGDNPYNENDKNLKSSAEIHILYLPVKNSVQGEATVHISGQIEVKGRGEVKFADTFTLEKDKIIWETINSLGSNDGADLFFELVYSGDCNK